MQMSKPF